MTPAPLVPRIAKLIFALAALALSAAVLIGAVVGGEDEAAPQASRAAAARALPAGKPVVLAFGGDVHFESTIGSELRSSPSLVLTSIAPVLRQADVAVVNLETAVTTGGAPAAKTFVFRAPPTAFAALARRRRRRRVDGEQPRDGLRRGRAPRLARGGEAVSLPDHRDRPERQRRPTARSGATVNGQRVAVIARRRCWTTSSSPPGRPDRASPGSRRRRTCPGSLQAVRAGAGERPTRSSSSCTGASSSSSARRRTSARSRSSSSPPARTSWSAGTRTVSRARAGWATRSSTTGSATSSGTGRASSRRRRASCSYDDGRSPRPRLPLGARTDRGRNPASSHRSGAPRRDRVVDVAALLHRPAPVALRGGAEGPAAAAPAWDPSRSGHSPAEADPRARSR